ncbi:MAG: LamG-like jellyroll fold domain-containing protein [Planctomycetota bacterium]|jgi:Tol biopolymer transport system component
MKWLNCEKIRLVLVVFVAAIVLDVRTVNADFTFGTPVNLGPAVNSSYSDAGQCISADGLSLYFDSDRPGGSGGGDLWVTTRDTKDDEWGTPVNLGSTVNSAYNEWEPSISADGLSLFFCGPDEYGHHLDLCVTTRVTTDDPWSTPVNLGPTVNSSTDDSGPSISADGLSLYFNSRRASGSDHDLYMTTRATKEDDWVTPVNLGTTVNSSASDGPPSISTDGLLLFFSSGRPGGVDGLDIWVTTRPTVGEPWEIPLNPGAPLNTAYAESSPCISPDGLSLYFCDFLDPRPGGVGGDDIWQAPIEPVVDFNIDGIVDSVDVCLMVDHWGQNYSLCDIGPTPLGDGTVDVQDIVVLAEYLFKDIPESILVAHWALDETEGMFAAESVGNNDAIFVTGATWQPNNGQIDGAIQLNGIDGYAITGSFIDPADGPFSIFAWIKGGAPGQIVVSQQNVANWLATDEDGNLMTDLKSSDQLAGPLISETAITDGQWHRIGLVWHGSNRTLYVDGVVVAEDTQPGLQSSQMGLYIGTGKAMESGTYFSGLIDDIRIYNRAVSP